MGNIDISDLKLGIIGGGQLGKMLCQAGSCWDLDIYVVDPHSDCSSLKVAPHFQQGDFTDYDTLYNFGKDKDVLTIEIERVNIDALLDLEKEGVKVYPEPSVVQLIQDKGLQKEFYQKHNIPSSAFKLFADKTAVLSAIEKGEITLPFVQKSRKDGYDGKGVHVVNEQSDLEGMMDVPCLVEDKVILEKELAVIVGRNTNGEMNSFPVVEMEFNPTANLVEFLFCPANISSELEEKAKQLAEDTINAFDMTGILAVEMFLDKDGNILVNEVAPRPHNSGHHTIEGCVTSQYEQLLRAILGFPLGSTDIVMPSVMINILGESGYTGKVIYEGLDECMAVDGFKPHIYGKKDTKPFRKMGHATIFDQDLEKAKEKARFVQNKLKVIA